MRKLLLTMESGERIEMPFTDGVMDSEALHEVLCWTEPGDNYTVEFSVAPAEQSDGKVK